MHSKTLLTIPMAILVVLTLPPAAAFAAGPVAITCGAELTTNAVLTADLTCPAGGGITVTGNVTIDLRGHLLSGPGADGTALMVHSGFSPQIKNGHIANWGTGIEYALSTTVPDLPATATISAVQFRSNTRAIAANGILPGNNTPGYVIKNSRFEQNVSGITGGFTGSITVAGSTFHKNQYAISLDTGTLAVATSRFDSNGTAIDCYESFCAVRTSYLVDNQVAIESSIFDITVSGNILRSNGVGLSTFATTQNAVSYNAFIGNKTAVEFYAAGGTVSRNTFYGNDIGFTAQAGGDQFTTTVDTNSFTHNGSGIFTEDGGISLRANIAKNNTEWGIYAPQSIDLGGNRASGNGNSPQCVGVVC